jgi:glucokinase
MNKKIITWDLGATKCAAAVVEYNATSQQLICQQQACVKIRECESLNQLVSTLEAKLNMPMSAADAICIGAAGQYDGTHLQLEKGYPYVMPFAQLANSQNWAPFAIIHDYSPIVCATFTSYLHEPQNIKRLNDAAINATGRRVALGVGTGVGLKDGILFENGDFWLGTNELGHIGVPTPPLADKIHRERHHELIKFLRSEHFLAEDEPLTFEKILADQGMVRIHSFFDRAAKEKTSEEIGELVRQGQAKETLATFAWYLGILIGTIELAFMPDGGVWITGGVILSHMEIFDESDFYAGITASPAYLNLRKQFPLGVLCGKNHAFMGAAYYASKRLLT